MSQQDDVRVGRQTGEKIWGKAHFQNVEEYLEGTSPYIHEMSLQFWSNFARPELDVKTRSLCMIAALTVMGRPEVRLHVFGALNNGATPEEVLEVIRQMVAYIGIPKVADAFAIANKTIKEYSARKKAE
ncbi:MAG: carboxymuconolactone decarboxylase family protein [Chloroflexota bacterium]